MTPFEILGLPETATLEEIRRAFKRLAQVHHPDKGGNPNTFAAIRRAYEQARKPKVCPDCQGKGHVRVQEGFLSKKVACPRCWS